jgi:hypothetical protein
MDLDKIGAKIFQDATARHGEIWLITLAVAVEISEMVELRKCQNLERKRVLDLGYGTRSPCVVNV